MRWIFSATPHRPWRKQIQLKSTWLNVFLYSLPPAPIPPKKTHPSSRQRTEQATGSRSRAPSGARSPALPALTHPVNHGAGAAADKRWKMSVQTTTANMSEARERKRADEEDRRTGSALRPHTAYSTRCACVCVGAGGVNTETVCKLSIHIGESFIPEAVALRVSGDAAVNSPCGTFLNFFFLFFFLLCFMPVVSRGWRI